MLKTFAYHKPSEEGLAKITKLREAYSILAEIIAENAPLSREHSVAITHLEDSAMWAIKSIVHNDPDSETEMAPTRIKDYDPPKQKPVDPEPSAVGEQPI